MNKKLISIISCMFLALACVILVGCGKGGNPQPTDMSGSAYVGTWKADHATLAGEAVSLEEIVDGEMILELNADGTAKLSSAPDVSEGVWSETSKGVKIKGEDIDMEFENKDGGLEANVLGVHILFVKQ